ncbi:hypothetical protein CBR_g52627 [Chara braunii]|uniref:Integrase zinc-binding domain-containing protein n=1 Tax=Chara braunii TaxID=69332 RepID=A0A388MAI5_CHABU|nr:hypothetical protein CBR_g52627 [Chara braunii]|eukprot:GBG91591.1 hypothetical protein CBR_g52627 [Chara braunii]
MNLLVHEDRMRLMNAEEGSSEVKEAFKEKEYEGEYKKIGMWLNGELDESEVDPVVRETSKGFVVRDGHLFKKAADGVPKRVVCGISRQLDVIAALHDGVAGGHRSARVTLNKIQRLYLREGMSKMVIDFCKSCFPCQQRSNIRYLEPLNPRYMAEPDAVVHLDLFVMPPGINGYRCIPRGLNLAMLLRLAIKASSPPSSLTSCGNAAEAFTWVNVGWALLVEMLEVLAKEEVCKKEEEEEVAAAIAATLMQAVQGETLPGGGRGSAGGVGEMLHGFFGSGIHH